MLSKRLLPCRHFLAVLVLFGLSACGGGSAEEAESTLAPGTGASTTATTMSGGDESTVAIGRSTGTILSAELNREYVLHVPASYDEAVPLPLVVVFHGYTMTAAEQASESGLLELGEDEGFITVLPQGRGAIQRWLFELDSDEVDVSLANPDIALASDLLDELSQELSIDSDRVYVVGFSNGGWMASAVACTLPDRFAAAAPVAGIMDFGPDCVSDDPVPLVTFHGTSDRYEPFEGGAENAPLRALLPTDLGGTFDELPVTQNAILEPSVPDKVAQWADNNGCEGDPISSTTDGVTQWEYPCPETAPVLFYEIAAGTHWWGITPGFDTSTELWDFLSSQSR